MSLDSPQGFMVPEFTPRSLDASLARVIDLFEVLKKEYDADSPTEPEEHVRLVRMLQYELRRRIVANDMLLFGERIELSGDMRAADSLVHAGVKVGYEIGRIGPTANHINARMNGVRIMPLPRYDLEEGRSTIERYEYDGLGINPFGVCLSLDQLAVISMRSLTKGGIESVRILRKSSTNIALGYTGLSVVEAVPREAIIAHYGK